MEVNVIALEAFGSIVSEDLRKEGVSLTDVLQSALTEIDELFGLGQVETVVTGMNADVTTALEETVEEMELDITVRAIYPDVNDIKQEDDISYSEAWKNGYEWRNNCLFNETDDDIPTADLALRVGDAGSSGVAFIEHARRKGVVAMDSNLAPDHVNREAAYGDSGAQEAEA